MGVTIALAIALLVLFRAVSHLLGSDFFDRFPLFPFTFPAAVLVQLCARRYNFEWAVDRRAVEGLGGMAVDGVIICAVGTLSLEAIGANVGPMIILAVAAIGDYRGACSDARGAGFPGVLHSTVTDLARFLG